MLPSRKPIALLLGTMMCLSLCACNTSTDEDNQGNVAEPSSSGVAGSGSPSPAATEARLAASLQEYFTKLYDDSRENTSMDDAQRDMLKRAAETGTVPASDYEAAWSNYKTCMMDSGYSEPVLRKFPNGIYQEAGYDTIGGTDEQAEKLRSDSMRCWSIEVSVIDAAYKTQVGNPGLYQDPDVAAVDCFHKTGAMPNSYTAEQYKDEQEAHYTMHGTDMSDGYSFDLKDPTIRGCLATVNYAYTDGNDPDEEIWYPFRK